MSANSDAPTKAKEEFGYLSLPDPSTAPKIEWPRPESFGDKVVRKTKENPFIPIGLGVTIFALMYGVYQLRTGDRAMSQKMMRLRVGAQGFTVLALLAGVMYGSRGQHTARPHASAPAFVKPE